MTSPASAQENGTSKSRLSRTWIAVIALGGVCAIAAAVATFLGDDGTAPEDRPADDLVWIPGGKFDMGTDKDFQDAGHARPEHPVTVDGFWMGKTELTNRQFAEFVNATAYKTVAAIPPKQEDFPDAPEELLVPFSAVFEPPATRDVNLGNHLQWWKRAPGADWRHPEGPDSDIKDRMDHPVVHVSWFDAVEYCKWRSKESGRTFRLPTEAEWEFAARGGEDGNEFVWGESLPAEGDDWPANIWQGRFPHENTEADGFAGVAPVASFPANGYGLHDMSGNVWEWCQDWYQPNYYLISPDRNPTGPKNGTGRTQGEAPCRVTRGGSFLCCDMYCRNYRTWTRHGNTPDSAANHMGFRVVCEVKGD